MASATDTYENTLADDIVTGSLYVALTSNAPTEDTAGTELTAADYVRVLVDAWDAASGGVTANTNELAWDPAEEVWGTVKGVELWDDPTAGNRIMYKALAEADWKTVGLGDIVKIAAGALTLTVS